MQKKLKVLTGSFIACLLTGAACCIFSVFVIPVAAVSNAAPSAVSNTISVNVSDAVAIRILDKTGSEEISSLDLDLFASYRGALSSDYFNVEVSTSNQYGYKLYVSSSYQYDDAGSPTYTNALVNTVDTAYQVPTLSGTVDKDTFSKSGNDSSGQPTVNTWGYSVDDSIYKPVPQHDTTDQVAESSTGTGQDLVPVYVAANMDMSKVAGIYQNQLVFSAIPNPRPTDYSLAFAAGTTDTVANMPETLVSSESSAQHTFTIPSNIPTRSGYVFTGWQDESAEATYQSGDSYTVVGNEEFVGSATLTAQWEKQDTWETITLMQQMTSTICSGAPSGQTKTLTDSRDNQSYTVAKLADGSCWMTQNLEIDGPRTLKSSDSDVTSNYSLLAETVGDVVGCNSLTSGGCIDEGYIYKETSTSTVHYYSWNAATAGTGTSSLKNDGDEAPSSICPKGWGLPNKVQLEALVNNYTKDTIKLAPPKIDKTGISYYSTSSTPAKRTYHYNTVGAIWGKTARSNSQIYTYYGPYTHEIDYKYKNWGLSIRCVAK